MTSPTKTLAFLGATGDCAGYALTYALQNSYTCIALARTPSKLTASLKAKGVTPETLDTYLTIIQGNAKDPEAIRKLLTSGKDGVVVDTIITGIGAAPKLQWSLFKPVTLDDPTVCQDVGKLVLKVARELSTKGSGSSKKPLLINVSTTGIPSPGAPWDVPFWFTWFYHYVLQDPHADKMALDQALREEGGSSAEAGIRGFVTVKPSLLMDGAGVGLEKVRVGTDEKPAIGYTIQRGDVGRFIFEKLVKEEPAGFLNRSVTITA